MEPTGQSPPQFDRGGSHGRESPAFPWIVSLIHGFSFSHAIFHLCCYFAFKVDELGYKNGEDSIVLATPSLTQTQFERLEEGERGTSESNGVAEKSKDHRSDF